MSEPLSHSVAVTPFTEPKIDAGLVPLIDRTVRFVISETFKLRKIRLKHDRVLNAMFEYLSQLDGLRHLTAIIAETAHFGLDNANEQGYKTFDGHASEAFDTVAKMLTGGAGTLAYPLPATHPALIRERREAAERAIGYLTDWNEGADYLGGSWIFLTTLTSQEKASSDVQQALQALNDQLAALMFELSLTSVADEIDSLLHDDWCTGQPETLTLATCNSLWDLVFLLTDRSTFDVVDQLLAEVVRIKAVSIAKKSVESHSPPHATDRIKLASTIMKVAKWAGITIPGDFASQEKERLMWAIQGWEETRAGSKFKSRYNADYTDMKTRTGKLGMAFDAIAVVASLEKAYEKGWMGDNWVYTAKAVADTGSAFMSAVVTVRRIYATPQTADALKTLEKNVGPIGPFCTVVTASLSLYYEAKQVNHDKVAIAQSTLQLLGAAPSLVGRLGTKFIASEVEAIMFGPGTFARLVLIGDTIAGMGNVVLAAAMVADAGYQLWGLTANERLKNERVIGVLRARLAYLQDTAVPLATSVKLHEYLKITDPLQKMEAMLPSADGGLPQAVWDAAKNAYYGNTQLAFFGLPAIFAIKASADVHGVHFKRFKEQLHEATGNAVLAGNRDGSRSTDKDYRRCQTMLSVLQIGEEDARQMMYWNQAQLQAIAADPLLSAGFWFGGI